jgi:hypothetical protein
MGKRQLPRWDSEINFHSNSPIEFKIEGEMPLLVLQIFSLLVLLVKVKHVTGRTSGDGRLRVVGISIQDAAIRFRVVLVERVECHRKQAVGSIAARNWTNQQANRVNCATENLLAFQKVFTWLVA